MLPCLYLCAVRACSSTVPALCLYMCAACTYARSSGTSDVSAPVVAMDNELAGVGQCDRKAGGQWNQWMPAAVAMKLNSFRPGLILLGVALLSVVLVMLSNTQCSTGSSRAPHGVFHTHEELGQQLSQGMCCQSRPSSGHCCCCCLSVFAASSTPCGFKPHCDQWSPRLELQTWYRVLGQPFVGMCYILPPHRK